MHSIGILPETRTLVLSFLKIYSYMNNLPPIFAFAIIRGELYNEQFNNIQQTFNTFSTINNNAQVFHTLFNILSTIGGKLYSLENNTRRKIFGRKNISWKIYTYEKNNASLPPCTLHYTINRLSNYT